MERLLQLRKKLSVFLTMALVISFLIPGKYISSAGVAKAKMTGRHYTGGLAKRPEPKYLGVIELPEDAEVPKLNKKAASISATHYSYLDDEEKRIYNVSKSTIDSGKYLSYKANINTMTSEQQMQYAVTYKERPSTEPYDMNKYVAYFNMANQAVYFDNPAKVQYYMVVPLYYGSYSLTTAGVTTYYDFTIYQALMDESKFGLINSQIMTGLNNWLADIRAKGLIVNGNDELSKAATEMNIHNYYAASIPYDTETMHDDGSLAHSAWGSLYKRYAVCDGYSTGFMMIMDALGIDTMVVSGTAGGGGHAWNMVKLEGQWYEVDTTWAIPDERSNEIDMTFFNETTEEYTKKLGHTRSTDGTGIGFRLPKATGEKYTFEYIEEHVPNLYNYSYKQVSGITPYVQKTELCIGDVLEVTAQVAPADASQKGFVVSSSDENVVSVAGNYITAEKPGTATITVRCVDFYSTKPQASINVTVLKNEGESVKNDGINYSIISSTDKTVAVTETENKNAKNLTIPSTIKDENGVTYTVTKIESNAFKNCKKLKKLVIPATVKEIGKKSFYNCKKLSSIKIYGNNLTSIGSGAFKKINKDCKITIYAKDKSTYKKVAKKVKKSGAKTQTYKYKKKS